MATMLRVHNESPKENESKEKELTPEYIQGKLFSFHNIAHKFHLDTKSFAQHKCLDNLYKELVEFKDDISEKLMGYMGGKRIGSITLDPIPNYSESAAKKLASDVMDFGAELEEWAENKNYCDIENIAQSLSGIGAETAYLLTLN